MEWTMADMRILEEELQVLAWEAEADEAIYLANMEEQVE